MNCAADPLAVGLAPSPAMEGLVVAPTATHVSMTDAKGMPSVPALPVSMPYRPTVTIDGLVAFCVDFLDSPDVRMDAHEPLLLDDEHPPMSVLLSQMNAVLHIEENTLIAACVYLWRVLQRTPGAFLSKRNAHTLVLASTIVAAKFWQDNCPSNAVWAHASGRTMAHIKQLEKELLTHLDWNLFVSDKEFKEVEAYIIRMHC